MMKNLSIILNVILLIAVAVLYIVFFTSEKKVEEKISENSTAVINLNNLPIAYVNTDSVIKNYKLSIKLGEELDGKQKKAESSYQTRATGLQREIMDFQNNAGNMTQNQALAVQEKLQQKQQNLMMYQQTLQQDLMKEEAQMTDNIYTKLTTYLDDYAKKNKLQYVLTYVRGSGVLFANDSLDITNQVIDGLNVEYEASLTVAKPAKDSTAVK